MRLRQICRKRFFEFFQDNDDLRIRQNCRRKSLWIFSGYCWFGSKTILQGKKSVNIFRILLIWIWDNFAGEKVFEYFQDKDDLRLRQFWRKKFFEYFQDNDDLRIRQNCRRKSLWIFSGKWWFAAKIILQEKILWIFSG